jgi:hypothetical protein
MTFLTYIKRNKVLMGFHSWFIAILIIIPVAASSNDMGFIKLEKNNFRLVFSEKEPGALKTAMEASKKKFLTVIGSVPKIVENYNFKRTGPKMKLNYSY